MKKLEEFNLSELFRYFLSGGVFVCVFRFSRGTDGLPPGDSAAVLFVVALVAGSVIYTVHRALVYPAFGRVALWLALGRPRCCAARYFNPFKPLAGEMARDEARWERRQATKSIQPHLDEWASHVHLLYCVAWATILGNGIANLWFHKLKNGETSVSLFLMLVIAISLTSGFAADYRRRVCEEQEYIKKKAE